MFVFVRVCVGVMLIYMLRFVNANKTETGIIIRIALETCFLFVLFWWTVCTESGRTRSSRSEWRAYCFAAGASSL